MTTKKKPTVAGARTATGSKTAAVAATTGSAPLSPAAKQMQIWGEAMQLFTKQQFGEACERFREATTGPAAHISDKARSYLQICERKTALKNVEFRTAEEHFNFGVERLNARDIEQARFHLHRALALDPAGDHIFYTMALCCGQAGDGPGLCENLKRAIELEPRNRILARQEAEFSVLAGRLPALRNLLSQDSSRSY